MLILAATRTPFSKLGSDLAGCRADELGSVAVKALLLRTGVDPGELSEVIFGCAVQPYETTNIARVIALRSGVPDHVPAATVQRNDASGFEAITTAQQRIAAGHGDLFLVGGVESMSHIPMLFPHEAMLHFSELNRAKSSSQKLTAAASFNLSDFRPRMGIELIHTDFFTGLSGGDMAEILAREFSISREAQDRFAAESHAKAAASFEKLKSEISPVYVGGKAVVGDNGIDKGSTPEELKSQPPVYDRLTGTVTAGNSSQSSDGAVALLVGTEEAARRLSIEPLGRLGAYAYSGCGSATTGLGAVSAIARLKALSQLTPDDADLVEIHEGFAARVLSVLKTLKDPKSYGFDLPPCEIASEKVNRRGGSLALGHPLGATGARLVLTALDQLRETKGKRALVVSCIGGGQGGALYLERT